MKRLLVCLVVMSIAPAAPAADVQPGRQPARVTSYAELDTYQRLSMQLHDALGNRPIELLLFGSKQGLVRAHAIVPGQGKMQTRRYDLSGLQVSVGPSGIGAVGGTLQFTVTREKSDDQPWAIELSLRVQGERLVGQYKLLKPRQESGSVSGTVMDRAAMHRHYGLPEGADWPQWYGPVDTHRSPPMRHELVNDLADARLVWISRQRTPPGRNQATRYAGRGGFHDQGGGGGATPVIKDGRLYLYYYRPAGEVYDVTIEALARKNAASGSKRLTEFHKAFWMIRGDDVVVCMDAATGQTLWETVLPLNAYYTAATKALMAGQTPVVADGRIHVVTGDQLVLAFDAETGRELWRTPGPRFDDRMARLQQSLRERKIAGFGGSRNLVFNLAYADGLLIVPTDSAVDAKGRRWTEHPQIGKRNRSMGLWAFDGATGKIRWKRDDGIQAGFATPVVWEHGGRPYLIVAGGDEEDWKGRGPRVMRCLDATTGRDVWTQPVGKMVAPFVLGDRAIVNSATAPKGKGKGQVVCLQLRPDGPVKQWELPVSMGYPKSRNGVTQVGAYLVMLFDRSDGRVVVEADTGKVVAEVPGKYTSGSLLQTINDRVICQPDISHGDTMLEMWKIDNGKLRVLTAAWHPPHLPSGSYEQPWVHPLLDGLLYIRGSEGIYCYDLRTR